MPITPEEIEEEHRQALESLSKEQRWALHRVQRAYQESHFNHRKMAENLDRIFEDEAQRRNDAESHRHSEGDAPANDRERTSEA